MKILIVEDQFVEALDLQLIIESSGNEVSGIATSAEEAFEMVSENRPDLICLDIFIKGTQTGIDIAKKLLGSDIGYIFISANSTKDILNEAKMTNPYGFIVKPFRKEDVITTLEIACYRHTYHMETARQQDHAFRDNLAEIIRDTTDWPSALVRLGDILNERLQFDYLECSHNHTSMPFGLWGLLRENSMGYKIISKERLSEISGMNPMELSRKKAASPVYHSLSVFQGQDFKNRCMEAPYVRVLAEKFGIRSMLAIPVFSKGMHYEFIIYQRKEQPFTEKNVAFARDMRPLLGEFLSGFPESHTPEEGNPKLVSPVPLPAKIRPLNGIIGKSKAIAEVLKNIRKVAPSDTSVLLLGESGTGKELIAQSIHRESSRKDKPFVAVNCGAIPANLAESILFGHEKGAYTGATERHIGKFESANGGTIFLDEIGELPFELQVKFLRVLQENEIERIGGSKPIKINARIIAATNKELEQEVAGGRFRIDLYYRLYVFPLSLPPLRERREDVPELANHFIKKYTQKLGKGILSLSPGATEKLLAYHWPGNVRELEHTIQRCVVMADDDTIRDISFPKPTALPDNKYTEFSIDNVKTINEIEKDYISHILKKCHGKVYGAGGAAELLNLPPSTLNSKIKKLGISIKSLI